MSHVIDPFNIDLVEIYLALCTAFTGLVIGYVIYAIGSLFEPR